MLARETPAGGWGATRRAGHGAAGVVSTPIHSTAFRPIVLQTAKRGGIVTLAKLVIARPLNRIAVAVPYRHRQEVQHPSLTPATLEIARRMGGEWWIVRLDLKGECYGLQLSEVEKVGWLKPSEGKPEWFAPLSKFQPMAWQEWPYVEESMMLEDFPARMETQYKPEGRQLWLFWGLP